MTLSTVDALLAAFLLWNSGFFFGQAVWREKRPYPVLSRGWDFALSAFCFLIGVILGWGVR